MNAVLHGPPHNGTDTSIEAASSVGLKAESMRVQAYRLIAERPMTCDVLEMLTGWSHQTASARIWELQRTGQIRDTGKRVPTRSGRKARVYEIVTTSADETAQ